MKKRNPRHGSMQFWPRVKARRAHARIRSWASSDSPVLGFAGYKVGMTHLMITDNRSTSKTKGQDIFCPATIIECPPLKVASIRFYKNSASGLKCVSQVLAKNLDKELSKNISVPKKDGKKIEDIKDYDNITLLVHTQPKLTGIGKKKPELFEIALNGKLEEKIDYAKERLGKDIPVNEVFKEGQQLDVHSVTTGKGFQGAVKRFGITLRSHKSEKDRRNPGSLGGWKAQGHVMYRVAHAGQTGYHQRTEYNKAVLKIGEKPEEVKQKGGFAHYGEIKNRYMIIKGSIAGPKKRMIKMSVAIRPSRKIPKDAPAIAYISKASKQ